MEEQKISRLKPYPFICAPPRPSKFSLDEWKLSSNQKYQNNEDQQQLADRILLESKRLREETKERAEILKATSDRRIEQRIIDIEFNQQELNIQRKELSLELEALSVYKNRLQDCLTHLKENALNISRKCLMIRDGRIGIDLVVDKVEESLQNEITTILGAQSLLERALEQLNEQMRRLRATKHLLDKDLRTKQAAIEIDRGSLCLKPTDLSNSGFEDYPNIDPSTTPVEDNNAYTECNILMVATEVKNARPLKVFIDNLLQQVYDDLMDACKKCNHEFKERILATKVAKESLENMHRETTEKIYAMQKNISELQKATVDKEGVTALAHTRLGRRAQRTGAELVRDAAGEALNYECDMLRHSREQLQRMLLEASSSLRYLLQTQLQLQEDINVKMNSIKIDEVDCMTVRQTLDYYKY